MNDLSRFIKPLSMAVGALLFLGAGYLGLNAVSGDDDQYQVTAYFTKAIGLFPNSDVDILGVPVGKVESVEPIGSQVRVVMNIDSQYKVPADAIAQIVPISVISDRYVQLAPVYEDGPALEDGAEIPVENTYIPSELDDVFKQLKKLLDAIEPGKPGEPGALGSLIVQLDQTLKDREEDLKGTLITGSQLTSTLADAQDDISGLLVNLDDLFGQLATRANSFGSLNRNFALVMAALAESRNDLEGTLVNLADLTGEVGSLVEEHGDRLGNDLGLAAEITSAVLEQRKSVEESLSWLPVVGKGFQAAYNPESDDIDVRDNLHGKLECELFEALPPGPVKDALREICRQQTGEPEPKREDTPLPTAAEDPVLGMLDCDEGVRKVKRQLRRVETVGLPADITAEVVKPLEKQLRKLKRECKKLGKEIADDPDLLERLEEIGTLPELDLPLDGLDDLSGNAASTPVPDEQSPSSWEQLGSWFGGFLSYVGVST
ncbi:MAG TPA: MCE family protein [Actinomycetota bacterium]|nr:MCE family protein [Actinomycetota bacterium]